MSVAGEKIGIPVEAFDALHPFSFATDEHGTILHLGRSLQKLIKDHDILYDSFSRHFSLLQPTLGITGAQPEHLIGELVVLGFGPSKSLTFRGQVVKIAEDPSRFIFSLRPVIAKPEQVSALGVEYADFELGAPIFDFLLISHVQHLAQVKLEQANELLRLDARMSRLLLRITAEAYRIESKEALYRNSIKAICQELGWSIGHVFFLDTVTTPRLVSSNIWYLSAPDRFTEFVRRTESLSWETDHEFPAFTLNQNLPVWIADYGRNGDNMRARALPSGSQSTAVSVPIMIADKNVALIEFISEQPQHFSETAYSFFALFGAQLGYALAYHEGSRKERERLAALAYASKMATLGEIAAGVAHEINNPISTISLISQILKRAAASDGVSREVIENQVPKIELCVDRVAKIVAELRDFSRESSKDPFQAVPLRKIIDETIDLCQARFVAQGVLLEVPRDLPDWTVYCRASQISQVILNLLNNAYDAVVGLEERWVRLECVDRQTFYEIAVSDSGAGVAEEIRDKIMRPFFTTKAPGRGTGLGLSISSNIATDHGGCLELDTAATHTRFVLALPKMAPSRGVTSQ
jgi:signal transduction histidine kinase